MESRLSNKISLGVFLATLIVVFRHSINIHLYNPNIYNEVPTDLNAFFQLFTNKFTTAAVPFFFVVSGFLLFNKYEISSAGYFEKLRKRFKSLLIPFVLINSIFALVMLLLLGFTNHKIITDFVSIESFNLPHILDYTFTQPALGQLWYIRDLIIFVVLSPLFFIVFRYKIISALVLLGLLWLWMPIDTALLSTEGILFFYIGGLIGSNSKKQNNKPKIHYLIFVLLAFICIMVNLTITMNWFPIPFAILLKSSILLNIIVFWLLLDYLLKINLSKWSKFFKFSFMIYILHAPLIKIIYKLSIGFFPNNLYFGSFVYILAPLITIYFCLKCSQFIANKFPTMYSLLTGGR